MAEKSKKELKEAQVETEEVKTEEGSEAEEVKAEETKEKSTRITAVSLHKDKTLKQQIQDMKKINEGKIPRE